MRVFRVESAMRAVTMAIGYIVAVTGSTAFGQGLAGLTRWEEGRSMRVSSNVWIENDLYDGADNMDRPDRIRFSSQRERTLAVVAGTYPLV